MTTSLRLLVKSPEIVLVCLVALVFSGSARAEDDRRFAPWEKAIAAFEARDREMPPPKHAVLFVGSSSIRFWDVGRSFPGLDVINRGFGGSTLADCVHFAPRIVLPFEPRTVVVYAGDNDIGLGKTPEQVLADFRGFVKLVRARLPETRIVYISIKPSLPRWKLVDKMRKANALIAETCKKGEGLVYVDVATPMLGEGGKPRRELFRGDGLHLNDKGYALWASVLKPHLSD